ncbi:hypothetical protein N7456_013378 [Penicillium angulare]|uniref:F-box domain-containing protein n=1 Tax=Penicillium angulare TaxID=116970 RepID=A0A9W9EG67_9EURO|nr:hypothetical protein N7456_013378 [Penicillium angulare]
MATDSHLEAPTTFTDFNPQQTCPLFSLPAELRYEIFSHALTSAPDKTRPIDQDAYCTRPGYETLSRTYTELLRTCKRIYMEAWFMPFLLSEHPFYMAWQNRSPKRVMSVSKMQKCLDLIYERHGKVEGGAVRIFAQLWALEGTSDCSGVLSMKNFYPKTITITIRYTDTWMWESNDALHIAGAWGGRLEIPSSVTRFNIDFESIERRKDEVDCIVQGFATRWSFRRRDGVKLVADGDKSISVSRWTGSSTLGDRRWRVGVPEGATAEEAIFMIDDLGEWTESEEEEEEDADIDDDGDDDNDEDNSSEDEDSEDSDSEGHLSD